ncbi:hypothetical protein [Capnocytophaga catalasegens]|nr:hypothetical protein [Capnocytophaga catalasegens]
MRNTISNMFFILVLSIFISCSKETTPEEKITQPEIKKEFDIKEHFIAGVLGDKNKSVYLIKFLEKEKAIFMNSTQEFIGKYKFTDKTLEFEVDDPNNYRIAQFTFDENYNVISSYYRALQMEYPSKSVLLSIPDKNLLAGKTFVGKEYKFGAEDKPILHYKFDETGTKYGSAVDLNTLTTNRKIELINNCAFRFKDKGISEIGFINKDVLTVFRVQGLYYFGEYKEK